MSDSNNNNNLHNYKAVLSSGLNKAQDVKALFQSGEQVIPGWMVAHLGGPNKFDDPMFREALKNVSWEDFKKGFHQEVESDQLNRIQRSYIQQHLRRVRGLTDGTL